MQGTVRDEAGRGYPGTRIVVSREAEKSVGVTSADGAFSIETKSVGAHTVKVDPPLATTAISDAEVTLTVESAQTATVAFVIRPTGVRADLVLGAADIFGEIRNRAGEPPELPDEALVAANVFDAPLGLLTAIETPDNQPVTLMAWRAATADLAVYCEGNGSRVVITASGLIQSGTYSFWLNFLNKRKRVGQPVDFARDVVAIRPLGSGTRNVAIADAAGRLTATIDHPACILTEETGLVVVMPYHINGQTFGAAHIPDPEEVSHLLFYFQ